jgi:hypothetical protein
MDPISDITITIDFGQRRRVIAPEALAEILGCDGVRRALLRLVLGKEGKGEVGVRNGSEKEYKYVSENGVENVSENNSNHVPVNEVNGVSENGFNYSHEKTHETFHPMSGSSEREGGSKGEEVVHTVEAAAQQIAASLATALSDEGSAAWYRHVAHHMPLAVIWDALRSTFELTPREIRRSRAAYFTGCVRRALASPKTRALNHPS